MAEERVFLNVDGVYVSNTRVVILGTTYATANITSVRKNTVPPNTGCATILSFDLLQGFPYLTHDDVLACLSYAAEREHRMLVANE